MTDSSKVKVNGRLITVSEATFVQSLQRSVLIAEATSTPPPKIYDGFSQEVITYVHGLLYPSLISCSTGKVPTEAEFIMLKEKDVNLWVEAASLYNADWFTLNGAKKEEQEKKE